jgi:hypothetical protein
VLECFRNGFNRLALKFAHPRAHSEVALMPQKAEDFFPEGCLVCLTHDDMGKERQSVKDQAA